MIDAKQLILRTRDEAAFWKHWNTLISTLHSGPRYAETNIKNFVLVGKSRGVLREDPSFIFLQNGIPVGGAFLPLENTPQGLAISFCGGYTLAPLFTDLAIGKLLFQHIESLAREHGVVKIAFLIDPLDPRAQYNFLQYYGYLDASLLTYVIDLSTPGDLLKQCRKGHVCDIKKLFQRPDVAVTIYDQTHHSYEAHERYRALHAKSAGRVTRPKESFDLQFEALKRGRAILVELRLADNPIAYAYFEIAEDKATYASGANDPVHEALPLSHGVLFAAMNHLRASGVTLLELSQPASPSAQFDYYPSAKELAIAQFKRGFPGRLAPYYRGIKYFSRDAFIADTVKFQTEYSKYI